MRREEDLLVQRAGTPAFRRGQNKYQVAVLVGELTYIIRHGVCDGTRCVVSNDDFRGRNDGSRAIGYHTRDGAAFRSLSKKMYKGKGDTELANTD
jgi:hypothetical protein